MAVWREKAVTIQVPDEALVLEGVWQAGARGGAVIAPPHPEYGGSLENPVVNDLAFGLHKADVPSLRFNWRGVGASQGAPTSDPVVAEADYRAAMEHLTDTVAGPLYGCGYSFGAAVALRVALDEPRISALVLVAPPVAMIADLPLDALTLPVGILVGSEDRFAPLGPLQELVEGLPSARLHVLPGIDHFFSRGGLADVATFARECTGS